ncbi:hypothetical protein F383_28102 [Gossypium arboreum]|uniref:Uncharacterized protein n=1 Tax=Gossypium arboreum TaxID=29729 RepID=A0A0B0P6M9_GOSAR|nr:hypothetical protein F383_28102 [Gossypium arboreum]
MQTSKLVELSLSS